MKKGNPYFIPSFFKAIGHRITHRHAPRVLANSMPKAGTHLLTRLLELLDFIQQGRSLDIGPDEALHSLKKNHLYRLQRALNTLHPGFYAKTHLYYYPEVDDIITQLGLRKITIVRDPRDVCVSDAFYIVKSANHRLHPYYLEMGEDDRLMASIQGMTSQQLDGAPPSFDIGTHYRHFLGWTQKGAGLLVRFEDLVGGKGGGDDDLQEETVRRIIEYLGLAVTGERLRRIRARVFWPNAATFRKGQTGAWKDHFKPHHLEAFNRVMGGLIKDFGFPSS